MVELSGELNLETAVGPMAETSKASIGEGSRPIFVTAEQFQMGGQRVPKFLRAAANLAALVRVNCGF